MTWQMLSRALLLGEPYFGPAMAALQGPPDRHAVLNALAHQVMDRKPVGTVRVLEVGSWAGASVVTFGKALKSRGRDGHVLCVDLWRPYHGTSVNTGRVYEDMTAAAEDQTIFHLFTHNIFASGLQELVSWQVGDSSALLPTLENRSFDLIYIDGSHIHPHVVSDIQNAKRLVADDGVICGDDLELEKAEVDAEAHRLALSNGQDYVRDPRTGCHYHPGVTEAVHETLPEVSVFQGVWAIRKTKDGWAALQLETEHRLLPEHIEMFASEQAGQSLCGSTEHYNLVSAGRRFIAAAKTLGHTELLSERVGERNLGDLILTAPSLEDLKRRVTEIETRKNGRDLAARGADARNIRFIARLKNGLKKKVGL